MVQLNTANNLFAEDIALGASITYVAGGVTVTVVGAAAIAKIHSCQLKAPTGTATGTDLLVAPVLGSESGQTFKMKAYQAPVGTVGGAFAELAAASTALQNLTVAVIYTGT